MNLGSNESGRGICDDRSGGAAAGGGHGAVQGGARADRPAAQRVTALQPGRLLLLKRKIPKIQFLKIPHFLIRVWYFDSILTHHILKTLKKFMVHINDIMNISKVLSICTLDLVSMNPSRRNVAIK